MKKQGQLTYVKKTFKVMVAAMCYQGNYQYHFHTNYSGVQQEVTADTQVAINQVFELNAIDTLADGKTQNIDKIINLQLYYDSMDIFNVTFDMSREKIVKLESKSMYRKRFNKGKGYIDYKFISVQTKLISKDQFREEEKRRNQIYLRKNVNYKTLEKENIDLKLCIDEKDQLINQLTDKINNLLKQNISLNKKINEDMRLMRSGMNINVNILATKKEQSKNYSLKDIEQLQKDYEQRRQEYLEAKERINKLEVENKRLEENISILISQMKMGGTNDPIKIQNLEKKMSEVDTLYLLKKNISSYEQAGILSQKFLAIPEESLEQQITHDLMDNFAPENKTSIVIKPPKLTNSRKDLMKQTFGSPTTERKNQKMSGVGLQELKKSQSLKQGVEDMRKSSLLNMKKSQQLRQGSEGKMSPKSSLTPGIYNDGGMKKSQSQSAKMKISGMHKSIIDSAMSKDDRALLIAKLEAKDKEVEYLNNQIIKKDAYIKKITTREQYLSKKTQELEEEKSRILTNTALNSLGKGGAEGNSEVLMRIKQLSVYSNELMRDKQQLQRQLEQAKKENDALNAKLSQFQSANRKSLMVLTQIKIQKQMYQKTCNELASGDKALEIRSLAEKGLEYEKVKEQLIETEKQLANLKEKEESEAKELQQKKEELSKLNGLVVELTKQKSNLGLIAAKADSLKRENESWNKKYSDIEKLQNGIKTFVLKMEVEVNKRMKNTTNDDLFQNDMKKLFREIFSKVNSFEQSYYTALLEALKAIEDSTEKYYEDIIKYYDDGANTPEEKADVWNRKMELYKEKDIKTQWIKQRHQIYRKKIDRKLLIPEDELTSVRDEIKKIEERVTEMEKYKIQLTKTTKEGGLAAPVIQIRSPEERSLNSSLLSMVEMIKSNAQLVKTIAKQNPDLLKISDIQRKVQKNMRNSAFPANQKIEELEDDEQGNKSMYSKGKKSISSQALQQLGNKVKEMKQIRTEEAEKRKKELEAAYQEKGKQTEMMRSKLLKQNQQARERIAVREQEMKAFREDNEKLRNLERALFNEKTEKQRAVMHAKTRQNELERQYKVAQTQFQTQNLVLTKEKERLKSQMDLLKEDIQEKENQIQQLSEQMTHISDELEQAIKEKNELAMINEELTRRIIDYEQGEKLMKRQVKDIQQRCAMNEEEMNSLFEERDRQFIDIEKIKSSEIEKLKRIVFQLEEKMAQQITEGLKLTSKLEDLGTENKDITDKLQKEREEASLMIQSLQNDLRRESLLREELQKENGVFHQNVLQLSENIENLQKEILRLQFIIDKYQKEKGVLTNFQKQLMEKQQRLKQDYKSYDYIIREKNEKLGQWEKNFFKLEQELSLIGKEIQSTKEQNAKLKEDNEKIKDKDFVKEREIIRLEREISCLQMNYEKLMIQNKNLENAVQELQQLNDELKSKIQQGNKLHLPESKSPKTPSSPLTPSRKIDIHNEHKDHNASIRQTFPTKTGSNSPLLRSNSMPQVVKDKSFNVGPQSMLTESIQSIHINVISQKQSGPSGSSSNYSEEEGNDLEKEKRPFKRPELIEVKPMIKNKYLQFPSMETEMKNSDGSSNLGIIQEHNEELNDTFLKSQRSNLANELQNYKMQQYEMEKYHPEQRAEQSAVDIDVMESLDANSFIPKKQGRLQQEDVIRGSSRAAVLGETNEAAFKEYENFQTLDLINRIMQLQAENQDLKAKLIDHSYSKIKSEDVSMLQIPEIRNTMRSLSSDMKNLTDRSSHEQPQKRVQRLETARSVNAMDFMIKQNEDEIRQLQMKCEQAEKKIIELELMLSENDKENGQLQESVDEKKKNIELLMSQIKNVTEVNVQLSLESDQLKKYCQKLKITHSNQIATLSQKSEELATEILLKDQALFNLELEFKAEKEEVEKAKEIIDQQQMKIKELQKKVQQTDSTIKKYQQQYIAYEEQAELQILRLKEDNDRLQQEWKVKNAEIEALAQRYLELEDHMQELVNQIKQEKLLTSKQEKQVQKMVEHYEKVRSDLEITQQQRKKVVDKTQSIDSENIRLKDEIKAMNKQAAMEIQKYNIKLTQQGELISHLKSKLQEKEKTIISLKNEIALYNEETMRLKRSNEELNSELIRAERQLKEIMAAYEKQFRQINQAQQNSRNQNKSYAGAVREKEMEIDFKKRQIKGHELEITKLKNDQADLSSKFQKYKLSMVVKVRDLENQVAIKNDKIQRLSNQINILTTKLTEEKDTSPKNKQFISYEREISELKNELEEKERELANKEKQKEQLPSIEEVRQLEFKVSLLQNQVKEIESEKKALLSRKFIKEEEVEKIYQKFTRQMGRDRDLLVIEREKSSKVINQLKQVIEAYKVLESDYEVVKKEAQSLRKANRSQQLINGKLQRFVNELQKENEELSRTPSFDLLSRKSFSRMMTDVTL